MSKRKPIYRFNPHTLSYEKVVVTLRDRLKGISYTLLFGVVLGVLLALVIARFFDSVENRKLKNEQRRFDARMTELNQRVDLAEQVLASIEYRDTVVYRSIFADNPAGPVYRPEEHNFDDLRDYKWNAEIRRTTLRIDSLRQRLVSQSQSLDRIYEQVGTKQQRMAATPAIMPIKKSQCNIVSGFGMRYHPILHTRRMHTGIDLTAKPGTPVYATGDGRVTLAGRDGDHSGYGIVVVIDHGFGYRSLYGHLQKVTVRRGQTVKRGQQVGTVGRTGLASGNHLHYEVLQNGRKVNPVFFFFNDLTPAEYEDILESAAAENQCLS